MLGLAPLLDRKPKQLSGGQRQRVAMGRAMVREPAVFLFDEPLSNLDASLRAQMRVEIGGLQRRLGTTTLYVTHDQVEAMTLADRMVVLAEAHPADRPPDRDLPGAGQPLRRRLHRHPADELRRGRSSGGQWPGIFVAEGSSIEVPRDKTAKAVEPLTLGIRPEDFRLDPAGDR